MLQGIDSMDFANDFSVSSKTKYYFIVSRNPSSEVFFVLNDMIHFIERIIRLASCSVETKQNLIFCIYYSHDKLLIRDYSKWSILNFTFLILDSYLSNSSIEVCKDACQSLSIINASKEVLQLLQCINSTCSIIITQEIANLISQEIYLCLQSVLYCTCFTKYRSSIPLKTKEKFVFRIYLGKDKFLTLNVAERSFYHSTFLILNLCILGQVIDTLACIIGSESIGHDYPFVRVDSIYLAIITLLCWRIANIIIGNTLEGTAVHSYLVVPKV